VIPPEQGEAGEQLASFLGSERSASGLAEHLLGVGAALGHCDLPDRVGVQCALIDGVLEYAQQQRAALLHGGVAGGGSQLGLPAADVGRADLVDGPVTKEWEHVVAQAALGHDQGVGATVGIGRPISPPQVSPSAEREPASPSSMPGVMRDLQPFLSCEGAGLVLAGDRLSALGAVIEQPPDLVGHQTGASANPAADAYRGHGCSG
jgi:hypothetical protein